LNYKSEFIKFDLKGGLAVAALSLPTGVAYAELIGLPPESGIFTAIFALLCYFLLGTSNEIIIGPDSVIIGLLTSSIITAVSISNGTNVQLIMFTSIAAGILFFVAGILRLGFISNFLSKPILTGFINGVAIVLIIGQLTKFSGVKLQNSNTIFGLFEFIKNIGTLHFPTLLTGIISLVLIGILKVFSKRLPAALVLLILSILAASFIDLKKFGIIFTPEITSGFPFPVLPDLNILKDNYKDILANASAIVLISYTNAILLGKSFSKDRNLFDPDREFFAMGLSDLVCGIFRGFPVGGSSSKSTVNISSGAKTKYSMVFAALSMILVMLFFSDEFSLIPSAVFAAIIIDAAYMMFSSRELIDIRNYSKSEFRISVICTIGVITIGVLNGILIALVLTIIQLINKTSHPPEHEIVFDPESGLFHYLNPENKSLLKDDILFYRFNSSMLFYNSDYFRENLFKRISERKELKLIVIDATPVNYIDITFRNDLVDIISELNLKNIKLFFCRASSDFERKLKNRLVLKKLNADIFFSDVDSVIKKFQSNTQI